MHGTVWHSTCSGYSQDSRLGVHPKFRLSSGLGAWGSGFTGLGSKFRNLGLSGCGRQGPKALEVSILSALGREDWSHTQGRGFKDFDVP